MIVDFHTHIFPDRIAESTIESLEKASGIKAFTNGTKDGLRESMKEAGIDLSVILPVVTKPGQFESVNRYAAQITGRDGFISFGGIHPDTEDYKGELQEVAGLGLKGIKLHPDYQKTYINDEKYVRIIKYAIELGLLVSIHSGIDVGLPSLVHCTPKRAADMLLKTGAGDREDRRIILAHTGGCGQWDEVEQYLVGKKVWFDLSFSLRNIKENQLKRILKNHGTRNILFGTDSPWSGQKEDLKYFRDLLLSKEEEDDILGENSMRLLELKN